MDRYKVQDVVPFEGRFPSWEAFDVARKAHCEKTHTMYVCRNTVKVEIANKRRKLQVPDHWVYDRKVYVCTHGYRRISRSNGTRPRQKVRYTSCKARFTASVVCELVNQISVQYITITGQHLEHDDHPVNLEQWRNYSQNRASIIEHPYLTQEAELLRRIGSNKRMAREHIETLSGKICTMKDMHNLYARLKKREETIKNNAIVIQENPGVRVEEVLQQFVDTHVENHVSILSGDDGSNEAICLASKAMKEHFQVFPELVLLEVTMSQSLDMDGYQLHGFMSMDALGNGKPVFISQSIHSSTSLLRRICQDFKRTHPKWIEIKVLVMDKLLPDVVDVVAQEFPNARLLLCQFHVIKFLSSLVTQLEFDIFSVHIQEQARELLKQMVFASSEQQYHEAKMLLLHHLENRLDHPLILHIDHHWEPYRHLWVSYFRTHILEFSAFFTKGLECFWNPLKNAFERAGNGVAGSVPATGSVDETRNASITKCISEVLTTIKFIEEEWTSKMLILEMTKPLTEFSSDPLLHFMVNCLSSFAVHLVSSQLMCNTNGSIAVTKGRYHCNKAVEHNDPHTGALAPPPASGAPSVRSTTVIWMDTTTRKRKHVMKSDCSACDCEFYQLYHLPCEHLIWYELTVLKHKQVSMSAVGQRWFLRTFQFPKLAGQRESNEIEYHIL